MTSPSNEMTMQSLLLSYCGFLRLKQNQRSHWLPFELLLGLESRKKKTLTVGQNTGIKVPKYKNRNKAIECERNARSPQKQK